MPEPRLLLEWYDRNRRRLPWRALPGETADPYRVWLSEVMLQQTTVATVKPYYDAFVAKWPTVTALAAAELDDVLRAWAGLGYYARARNLHACARAVVERYRGEFPADRASLEALPGIGAYTAAAIAAIAFGKKATPVDGNVERVVSRLFAIETPLPDVKPELRRHAETITPDERPGDWAQALMDLGATVCTPAKPLCALCPWSKACRGRALGIAESLPARRAKAAKPVRRGVAFVALRDGAVLLRRRPPRGLLGGLLEVPSTEWRSEPWREEEALESAPAVASWRALPGTVRHVFTHFALELEVRVARTEAAGDGIWVPVDRLGSEAIPSVMRKVLEHALRSA
ncbi:MAG: A/G-specific adenine glycosylase [Rhodospirillales bacterium]|nr:A/G-specific adenine glycosylase [Rhodospirillales bacterium]